MMVAPAETTVRTTTRTNLADRFKSLRTHLLSFATLNVLHDVITAARGHLISHLHQHWHSDILLTAHTYIFPRALFKSHNH